MGIRLVFLLNIMLLFAIPLSDARGDEKLAIMIGYLREKMDVAPALSNLEDIPADEGLAGARLAIKDNDTTGKFLNQRFELIESEISGDGDLVSALSQIKKNGSAVVMVDVSAESLDRLLQMPQAEGLLFINVGLKDDRFRTRDCRSNLLHTMPSRAMLSDALTQYLVKKRWVKWSLIEGMEAEDHLFADALRRSAQKFGAKFVEEKVWSAGRDARRTAQEEIPRLTQGRDYDVLMVADERGDFGEYLMYRTWDPRPVAGTQGLFPTAWFWTLEQWGATQLQNRFFAASQRRMGEKDYSAWVAVRALGEAASRTRTNDMKTLIDYIQGPDFEIAAFKGRKLSFRPWSGQLRQPIAVSAAKSLVSQSPQEGFLHRVSELDTLGFDAPEVSCQRKGAI